MEEGRMVEPDRLAGLRMAGERRANRSRPQAVLLLPLGLDPIFAAMAFDRLLVGGLEHRLPGEAEAIPEIADVHPLPLGKAVPDLGRDPGQYLADIGDRSLPVLLRWLTTEEENLQRPLLLIGVLVVQKDRL